MYQHNSAWSHVLRISCFTSRKDTVARPFTMTHPAPKTILNIKVKHPDLRTQDGWNTHLAMAGCVFFYLLRGSPYAPTPSIRTVYAPRCVDTVRGGMRWLPPGWLCYAPYAPFYILLLWDIYKREDTGDTGGIIENTTVRCVRCVRSWGAGIHATFHNAVKNFFWRFVYFSRIFSLTLQP